MRPRPPGNTHNVPEPLPVLAPGVVLSGRYRLESQLGAGATAAVWRARDLDLGREVAVKALLGADVEPLLAARFEREGQILGRLDHPNVVPVHCTGSEGGRPYLVMELIEGLGLDAVLQDGPLPVEDALSLAADVAEGLAAAHRAGVVHRDVKPANILCGSDGVPRIVDFGIARVDDLTSMTRADVVLGTASYLAPEQARGDATGPATDVYALGCVLFECLTGRPPFEGDSALTVAYRHVHEAPPSPASLREELPPAVDALVLRCLAKDPAARCPGAAELAVDLRRVRDGGQPTAAAAADATIVTPAVPREKTLLLPAVAAAGPAERIDPSPLVEEPARRRPWGLVAAAAAAALVLALLVGSAMSGGGGGTPVDARDTEAVTSTTVAPTTTAFVPPPPPPEEDDDDEEEKPDKDEGKGEGKGNGKGNGKGDD